LQRVSAFTHLRRQTNVAADSGCRSANRLPPTLTAELGVRRLRKSFYKFISAIVLLI